MCDLCEQELDQFLKQGGRPKKKRGLLGGGGSLGWLSADTAPKAMSLDDLEALRKQRHGEIAASRGRGVPLPERTRGRRAQVEAPAEPPAPTREIEPMAREAPADHRDRVDVGVEIVDAPPKRLSAAEAETLQPLPPPKGGTGGGARTVAPSRPLAETDAAVREDELRAREAVEMEARAEADAERRALEMEARAARQAEERKAKAEAARAAAERQAAEEAERRRKAEAAEAERRRAAEAEAEARAASDAKEAARRAKAEAAEAEARAKEDAREAKRLAKAEARRAKLEARRARGAADAGEWIARIAVAVVVLSAAALVALLVL